MASYSDNFNRGDGEIGANWIEDNGDIDIDTNTAVPQTADVYNRARYVSALDSVNHYVQATFGRINSVSARQASSTDTCYTARVNAYENAAGYRLYKFVDGAETVLDSANSDVAGGTIRITLTVDGATQVMLGRIFDGGWVEDQEVCSDTDSDVTVGLYAGMHGYHNFSSYDDWSAEDLAAADVGFAWGEQNPTGDETSESWQTWSDGAAGIPDVTGDSDWGKLALSVGKHGRSPVKDTGNTRMKRITVTKDKYGSGSGVSTVQIRGQAASFNQDDANPSWETYTVPVKRAWQYVQARINEGN